jgi:glycosyltransferase involved in cell wall biosynthesis
VHISVAICTWNRCQLLRATLERLTAADRPSQASWDVLVVNNNCADETSAVIDSFRDRLRIREVLERQPGLSHARNRALREATADYLVWIDDDVLVDRGWLTAFVAAAELDPEAAGFGGPIAPWFAAEPDPALLTGFPVLRDGFCALDYGPTARLLAANEPVYGANMAFALPAIRGLQFDPSLGTVSGSGIAGEEEDFVRRLRRSGGQVRWVPEMRVLHYVDPSRMTLAYLTAFAYDRGRTFARLYVDGAERRLFGAPRWAWRILIQAYAKYSLLRLTPYTGEALTGLREFHRARGIIAESLDRRSGRRSGAAAQDADDIDVGLGAGRPSEQ